MSYQVRFTSRAKDDLQRLYRFLLGKDITVAKHAYQAICKAVELLEKFPFTCRKVRDENPFLRELLIPFGSAGYLALFEIEDQSTVTILTIRHQREDDYY